MEMNEYQELASVTDRVPGKAGVRANSKEVLVPLLGLSGEVGELLGEYKKYLRDEQGHELSVERIKDELGDIMWYLANLATKFDLEFEQVARWNLQKVNGRWGSADRSPTASLNCGFDAAFPENERLPRRFTVTIIDNVKGVAGLFSNGIKLCDLLSDDRSIEDGYRFHDVFHFTYAAVLGWSPVTRGMLKRKRKSDSRTDEVEDGGRAIAIEEGISSIVFSYATQRDFFVRDHYVSNELLRTIKDMTAHLEVARCTTGDWEKAIRVGFDVWRRVQDIGAADLIVDLDRRSVEVSESGEAIA
jgi:NTP pyrophosphatase (non-canonical NTP hydrolase)/predicted Rdx family selenoprotein